ncbi:MAG: nucleoside deaminase [Chitinophagaceae bacterium]|nr:nucleoside deaminase [Chitinophagaceae bacterium]
MSPREMKFMQAAIDLSRQGMHEGQGGPFGCIIVKNDVIVGKGCNCVTTYNDPTAHAEIVAIRDACKSLNHFQLTDCELYTSCEPCPMCLGAIYWARPSVMYFANTRKDATAIGFDDSFIYDELNVPIRERAIQTIRLEIPDALKVFEEWAQKPNKTVY